MIPFIFSIGLTANFILMHENAAADFLLPPKPAAALYLI